MRTEICEHLGIEYPIFAFTHCRDVAAAVTNAGGLGVLGLIGFTPEEIETELSWIDDQVGDRPYGVDVVIPGRYAGQEEQAADGEELEARLREHVPDEHVTFARELLAEQGVPEIPEERRRPQLLGWTATTAKPQIDVVLRHEKVRLVANALGTPPPDVIEQVRASGRLLGALCGTPEQALRHRDAGLDFVVAQGSEAGGHCGDVSSLVLWPQVVRAVGDLPVLAAGGIGSGAQVAAALAQGCQGAWTGSIWLTVHEADTSPVQRRQLHEASSRDTVRSRAYTGKPARMLRNAWTEAWERDDTPNPLPMPLQYFVSGEAMTRSARAPEASEGVLFNPVGQIVGELSHDRGVKEVMGSLVEEFVAAVDRLDGLVGR